MNVELAETQELFLQAMATRYADGATITKVVDMPFHRQFTYYQGSWCLLDRWIELPHSEKFTGATTIWHESAPVWSMHYGGQYPKEAMNCLKLALQKNYQNMVFLGGRGPEAFRNPEGKFIYSNALLEPAQKLNLFEGCEVITESHSGKHVGSCNYSGMSLLP